MRSKTILLAPLLAVLCVAGCGTQVDGVGVGVKQIRLPDGRTVVCVVSAGQESKGGISCDWAGAK